MSGGYLILRQTLTPIISLRCLSQRLLKSYSHSLLLFPSFLPPQLYFLSQSSDLTRVATLFHNMWSPLPYACTLWEGTLSRSHFSHCLSVSPLHVVSETTLHVVKWCKTSFVPVSQSPIPPKPSHRQCVALLPCRASVPEGQTDGLFLAST